MEFETYSSKVLSNGIRALTGGRETGTLVICIPGWPQTAEAFAEIYPFLAQTHKVLILDPPGLGDSAPSATGYDTKTISNILAEAVHRELGQDTKYHLVSHDVGAWIAYAWTAQHHSSVLSLTVIDSFVPGLAAPLSYPLPDEANIKLWQFAFNRLPDLPEILTHGKERELLDWLFDRKSAHPERITPKRRARYVECYARPGGMSNGFAYYRAVSQSARQNCEEFATEKLNVPVLALAGETAAGEAMRVVLEVTATPKSGLSKFVSVKDCGHYVMEEQPEVSATEILAFLDQVEDSSKV